MDLVEFQLFEWMSRCSDADGRTGCVNVRVCHCCVSSGRTEWRLKAEALLTEQWHTAHRNSTTSKKAAEGFNLGRVVHIRVLGLLFKLGVYDVFAAAAGGAGGLGFALAWGG